MLLSLTLHALSLAYAAIEYLNSRLSSGQVDPLDFADFLISMPYKFSVFIVHPESELGGNGIIYPAFVQDFTVNLQKEVFRMNHIEIPEIIPLYTGRTVGELNLTKVMIQPARGDDVEINLEHVFASTLSTENVTYSDVTIILQEDLAEAKVTRDVMETLSPSFSWEKLIQGAIDRLKETVTNMLPFLSSLLGSDAPSGFRPDMGNVRMYTGVPVYHSFGARSEDIIVFESLGFMIKRASIPEEPQPE